MRPVRTIATTGHRALPHGADRHIRAGVREIAGQHPGAVWLSGGAVGADTIVVDELLEQDKRVELVLPFDPLIQSARWTWDQKWTQMGHLLTVAEVHVLADHYDPAAYNMRNQWMVDRADLLVAFWNGRMRGSGTANTVRMADRAGLPVIWFPMR